MDFGSQNPTVCLWIAVDEDENWYIIDEHYESGQTIDYHAGVINSKSKNYPVVATYGDPSGAQWIQEFAQRGIYITPAFKETSTAFNTWVRFKIEKVAEKLKLVPVTMCLRCEQRLGTEIGMLCPRCLSSAIVQIQYENLKPIVGKKRVSHKHKI